MSPWQPAVPCRHPGCPNLDCQVHGQRAPDNRPSAAARGYDRRWQRLRRMYLRAHPICEDEEGCDQAATEVHHRIARAAGGTDEWDNLQALCHSHHSKKTIRGE
jgi:5-methylcytosine-specific restriction protein A